MRFFFEVTKLLSVVAVIGGIGLTAYISAVFLADIPININLIAPSLWGYPVFDWLLSLILIALAVGSFVYAAGERRTWWDAIWGLPLCVLNLSMVYVWWSMEVSIDRTDLKAACIVLMVVMVINAIVVGMHVRKITLPAIQI